MAPDSFEVIVEDLRKIDGRQPANSPAVARTTLRAGDPPRSYFTRRPCPAATVGSPHLHRPLFRKRGSPGRLGTGLERLGFPLLDGAKTRSRNMDQPPFFGIFPLDQREVAEREGFEPSVSLHPRRISSAVHSTTLPPLREVVGNRLLEIPEPAPVDRAGAISAMIPGLQAVLVQRRERTKLGV